MKGLTWVGACVAIGIAAGALAFALNPARYRALTALQVTVTRHPSYEAFKMNPSDEQFERVLHHAFSEDWTENLMEELGLYREEREAGHFADALLRFRRSTAFSRRVESDISERWTVAFEADDPSVAEEVSYRLASFIAEQGDNDSDEADEPSAFLLKVLREQLLAAESEIETWRSTHEGKTPPAALMKPYEALHAHYSEVLKGVVHGPHRFRLLQFQYEMVKTPRVSDGRIGPSLLPLAGAGGAAGLFIGLFTMPIFPWWRRHAP